MDSCWSMKQVIQIHIITYRLNFERFVHNFWLVAFVLKTTRGQKQCCLSSYLLGRERDVTTYKSTIHLTIWVKHFLICGWIGCPHGSTLKLATWEKCLAHHMASGSSLLAQCTFRSQLSICYISTPRWSHHYFLSMRLICTSLNI